MTTAWKVKKFLFSIPIVLFFFHIGSSCLAECTEKCHREVVKWEVKHKDLFNCTMCHGDVGEYQKSSGHGPVDLEKTRMACLNCHRKEILDDFSHLHTPIKGRNGCLKCHVPHGSRFKGLLVDEFPEDGHVKYSKNEYRLCFRCHKRDLLMFPDTSYATGFRDGDKNLHFFHVKHPRRGVSCRLCHMFHGSMLPSLMATKVPYGRWAMPIGFKKAPDGGACIPGCHDPRSYRR